MQAMADRNEIPNDNAMNLDLNLGPGSDNPIIFDEWSDDLAEAVRRTSSWGWLNFENRMESRDVSRDLSRFPSSVSDPGGDELHMGEGSVVAEERVAEVEKMCENTDIMVDDETPRGQAEDDKGSCYDCNICFDLAKDPVITCCGHLYCWPCIYRWLHIHSGTSDCPVCKGEVTTKTVTPIYGRGHNRWVHEEDLTIRIPPRPTAKRVESRQMSTLSIPVEEMFQSLGSLFDLTRDSSAAQDMENTVNPPDRNPSPLLNRMMTTPAMRREQILALSDSEHVVDLTPEHVVDLTRSERASPDAVGNVGLQRNALLARRYARNRATDSIGPFPSSMNARLARRYASNRSTDSIGPFPSSMSASERVIEAYMRSHPIVASRSEQSPPIDDRDSFSNIDVVMRAGRQTMDTVIEIDSVAPRSASSSGRRNDTSRASDADGGDSRQPRRRRLN